MNKKAKQLISDLSEAADTTNLYAKTCLAEKRIRSSLTLRSNCYSKKSKPSPCAGSLLRFELDCGLMKFALILIGGFLTLWVLCSLKKRKKHKC